MPDDIQQLKNRFTELEKRYLEECAKIIADKVDFTALQSI